VDSLPYGTGCSNWSTSNNHHAGRIERCGLFLFPGSSCQKEPRKNFQRFVGAAFGGGVVTLCQIFTIDGHANQIAPATVAMPMRFATW
jgi:hypothetical protein